MTSTIQRRILNNQFSRFSIHQRRLEYLMKLDVVFLRRRWSYFTDQTNTQLTLFSLSPVRIVLQPESFSHQSWRTNLYSPWNRHSKSTVFHSDIYLTNLSHRNQSRTRAWAAVMRTMSRKVTLPLQKKNLSRQVLRTPQHHRQIKQMPRNLLQSQISTTT